MRHGTVWQRHSRTCPPAVDGVRPRHRCRGSWAYNLFIGRDSTGQRLQTTKGGFTTRAEAQEALRERAKVLAADVTVTDTLVGEYLQTWLGGKHALRPTSRRLYESLVRHYLLPHLGDVRLLELRPHHLDRVYAAIATGKQGRPLSASTTRRIHAVLRSALASAVKRRLLPYDPADHIELAAERPQRAQPWTVEESLRFLDAAREDRLVGLCSLLLHTGMRRGEAMGLRWSSVDLDRSVLRVVEQLTEVGGHLVTGAPKTRRGHRTIALDPDTTRELVAHRDAHRAERYAWGQPWARDGLVFTREDGRPYRPEYVTRHFQHLAAAAGLPRIQLHDLRHTSASIALSAGVPLKVVSERLGHSTVVITGDLHTHVLEDVERAAAASVGRLLRQPEKTLSSPGLAQRPSEGLS